MTNQQISSELHKKNIENILPLTSLQTGMLYHDLVEREQGKSGKSYNQQLSFRISGPLNKIAFELSWQQLINRHAALRTVYKHDKAAEPMQIVLRKRNFTLHYIDLSALNNIQQQEQLHINIKQDRALGFDIENELLLRLTLVKISPKEHWVLWSFHHIVLDGWCITPLQQELFSFYEHNLKNTQTHLSPAPAYSDYVEWIRRQDLHLGFWHQQLKGFYDVTSPPLAIFQQAVNQNKDEQPGYSIVTARVQGKTYQKMQALGQKTGATLSTLIHAIWGIYLGKVNDCNDVVFGSVQSTRPMARGQFDNLIGLCINTIPCRIKFNQTSNFYQIAKQTQDDFLGYIEHGTTGLSDIKEQCSTSKSLFDHYIAFENYPAIDQDSEGREVLSKDLYADQMTAFMPTSYHFHLSVFPAKDELEIAFKYKAHYVEAENIESIAQSFIQLAECLVTQPECAVNNIPLLNDRQQYIIKQHSQGAKKIVNSNNVIELYQKNINKIKHQQALVDTHFSLTHEQLDNASNRLAQSIVSSGYDGPVALLGYASAQMVIAMFACLRLGIAYIPLDPSNPIKRTQAILTAAKAKLVISNISEKTSVDHVLFNHDGCRAIYIDMNELQSLKEPNSDTFVNKAQIDSDAYIIFTSGSTGEPKGVPVKQKALLNYILWSQDKFSLDAADSSILLTSFCFDLGYTALFGSLIWGGTLHIANEQQRRDPNWLNHYLVKNPISFIKITPSYLHMLIKTVGAQQLFNNSKLKSLILGGEELDYADLEALHRYQPLLNIYNHYGPSENTIGCSAHFLTDTDFIRQQQVIGEPAFNVQNYVCGSDMALLPAYVEGDLYLGGEQLINSYLDKKNNSGRLVTCFEIDNKKLYKSGDRAYRDHKGLLVFSGREEQSCKIDGYRVDLKSIQRILIEHDQIKDALVTHFKDKDNLSKIIALLIPEASYTITLESLRDWLSNQLPSYMLPSEHIMVSRFPITANGKLDQKKLTEFWQHSFQSSVDNSANKPINHTEFVLLKIWQKILFRDHISINDDFFALGGHSIKAILCLGEMRKQLSIELPIQSIFNNPTISKLAKLINQKRYDMSADNQQHVLLPLDIRHKKAQQVVYCLPPAIGTPTIYKELFMALNLPLNAYGFQCGGFMSEDSNALSLETLADIAAEQISEHYQGIKQQSNALIMAYSFGGILALEVGKRLETKGIKLPMVLIDASLSQNQDVTQYSLTALKENSYWRGVIGILEESCSEAQFDKITQGAVNNQQRMLRYLNTHEQDLKLINSPLVCIEANANLASASMIDFANKTSQKILVLKTPGDHFSIFQPPNIEILLENLRDTLKDFLEEASLEVLS
ncbi:non-ribosomal peptide synthetase [Pseudoalteromonas denitrificans]|uniref:non-ribosomal peptide synthetase n=1 Tax=Pseudoalteromonas denitrificans TaxID=43656 RepID=UPI00116014FB|nr:condensation domain-containing protein [Pseudoalteromonas denitrificans]